MMHAVDMRKQNELDKLMAQQRRELEQLRAKQAKKLEEAKAAALEAAKDRLKEELKKASSLSEFIVAFRALKGWSQRDLARKMGISGPYVAMVESDKFHRPIEFIHQIKPMLSPTERKQLQDIMVTALIKELDL